MPSSEAGLAKLLEQSSLTDAFVRAQFSGRAPGRHTMFAWKVVEEGLVVERQPVTLSQGLDFVSWKPEARRIR